MNQPKLILFFWCNRWKCYFWKTVQTIYFVCNCTRLIFHRFQIRSGTTSSLLWWGQMGYRMSYNSNFQHFGLNHWIIHYLFLDLAVFFSCLLKLKTEKRLKNESDKVLCWYMWAAVKVNISFHTTSDIYFEITEKQRKKKRPTFMSVKSVHIKRFVNKILK